MTFQEKDHHEKFIDSSHSNDHTEGLFKPIGRDEELNKFQAILDERMPALLTLTGENGMGKSTFLGMAASLARKQNWNVLSFEEGINPGTTIKDFEIYLHKYLERFQSKTASFGETISSSSGSAKYLGRVTQSAETFKITNTSLENLESDGLSKEQISKLEGMKNQEYWGKEKFLEILNTTIGDEQGSANEELILKHAELPNEWSASYNTRSSKQRESENLFLHPTINQLKRLSPVVLQIDGYKPAGQFELWFTQDFIQNVLTSRIPIVIVVSDRPSAIASLAALANHQIQINEIPTEEISDHFENLNAHIDMAIEAEEARIYSEEVAKRPAVFEPLTRILLLKKEK